MKQQAYLTDTEYIEAMMKRFKLVDMRKQYRDLVLEAESSCMGYEAFLKRLLSVEEEGKRSRRTDKLRRRTDGSFPPRTTPDGEQVYFGKLSGFFLP